MKYILIILSAFVFNEILLNIYCRIEEIIDKKMRNKRETNCLPLQQQDKTLNEEVGIFRRVYRWLNSYMYGYMRTNIILVGKIPSHRIRKFLYKYIFRMKIKRETIICGGAEIRSPWNIKIGKSTIASNCILDGRGGIEIGDNVVFGSGVHVWTEEHDVNDPWFRVMSQNRQPVIVKDRAWVCSDVTLLPGVIIGEGTVVAARGCVTKACDDYGIYAGVPAKKISERNRELEYNLDGKPVWHFL